LVAGVFRPGGSPPRWCELADFKLFAFEGLKASELRRQTSRERLIVTAASLQITFAGRSQVFSERQFFDLPNGVDEYALTPVRAGAHAVRLMGTWGDELGGCGVFTARNEEKPRDQGDPVKYEKHTLVDSHYHDCDEYWIGLEGWGEAIVGENRIRFEAGECVPIRTGHHHDLPNAPEGIRAIFFETTLTGKKRVGHLWEHTHGPAVPLPE
jgi:mannose-6-phosphate isomerase-like protein (cupin superfamily)